MTRSKTVMTKKNESPTSTYIRDWCNRNRNRQGKSINKAAAVAAAAVSGADTTPSPPSTPPSVSSTSSLSPSFVLSPPVQRTIRKRKRTYATTERKNELRICPKCNYALPDTKANFPSGHKCVICAETKTPTDSSSSPDNSSESSGDSPVLRGKTNVFRTCKSCKMTMPLQQNFEINSTSMRGTVFRKWKCKLCRKVEQKQLAKIKKNINMQDYYGKPCCICHRKMTKKGSMRATPDHCHETGTLRSVICNDCNTSIGKLGDSVVIVGRALQYLEFYQSTEQQE